MSSSHTYMSKSETRCWYHFSGARKPSISIIIKLTLFLVSHKISHTNGDNVHHLFIHDLLLPWQMCDLITLQQYSFKVQSLISSLILVEERNSQRQNENYSLSVFVVKIKSVFSSMIVYDFLTKAIKLIETKLMEQES